MQDLGRAYTFGAHSFLVKPVSTEDFMNLIRSIKGIRVVEIQEGCWLQRA